MTKDLLSMRGYLRPFARYAAILLVYEAIIVLFFGLNSPPYHDEEYFVETIRGFGQNFSIMHLHDYQGVTPPLVFLVYALWGMLFGFGIVALRIFNLLLAFCGLILFHSLLFRITRSERYSFIASLVLLFNPYMIGITLFVYTDLLMLVFVLLFLLAAMKQHHAGMTIASAGGLLCRQYFIFVPLAGILFFIMKWFFGGQKQDLRTGFLLVFSGVPLAALMYWWGNLAPHTGIKYWPAMSKTYFHPGYFSLYVALITVYLFPTLLIHIRQLLPNHRYMYCVFAAFGVLYWFFPVIPSELSLSVNGKETVGFFHRILKQVLPYPWLVDVVFSMCVVIAASYLTNALKRIAMRVRGKSMDLVTLIDSSVVLFLLIMPFSFHVWEKYFLPLVPLIILRFAMTRNEHSSSVIHLTSRVS